MISRLLYKPSGHGLPHVSFNLVIEVLLISSPGELEIDAAVRSGFNLVIEVLLISSLFER